MGCVVAVGVSRALLHWLMLIRRWRFFLNSVNLTHHLPKVSLIVVDPCIMITDLQRCITYHFPHALDLLCYFLIIHYAYRHHLVKTPEILLYVHNASVFVILTHPIIS